MELKAIYKEIGKTLAPVEIESEEAMRDFGITKKDLVPLMVGLRRIMIYPYPAPEKVCREMLRELWQRYKQEYRVNRCLVPGKNGGLHVCPDKNVCARCPFSFEEIAPRRISLEFLLEEGVVLESNTDCLSEVDVELFYDELERVNPVYHQILVLRQAGYKEAEISQRVQIPLHAVKYARKRIREFAVRYFSGDVL